MLLLIRLDPKDESRLPTEPLRFIVFVVIPESNDELAEIFVQVLTLGPPFNVVTLLDPELRVVENDVDDGESDILRSVAPFEVDISVELPASCNRRLSLFGFVGLIHRINVVSAPNISGFV